jgi:glyoxylate/hydroxypyruvate reductase A
MSVPATVKLLFHSDLDDPAAWIPHLRREMPGLEVEVWPKVADPRDVDVAFIWTQPPEGLSTYTNLKAILALGAGINQLDLASLPSGVPLARLVDPMLAAAMADYCLYAVLHYQREFDRHARAQAERRWNHTLPRAKDGFRVGVMGLGEMGGTAARLIAGHGFPVRGWTRTPRTFAGISCFAGDEALGSFAAKSDLVICLLPLTAATRGILGKPLFDRLPAGAFVVNAGRGAHVVDADLVAALDSGRLGGAMLDVFREEPLPSGHPFWAHPLISVTPHVASFGDPRSATPQVVENVRRALAGRPLLNQVDVARGY